MTTRLVLAALALTLLPTHGAAACMGDLNGDGAVRIDELVEMVACAMNDDAEACPQPPVVVDELVLAVNNAVHGCEAEAVGMRIVACRQCEPCPFFTVSELVRFLIEGADGIPDELLPDGVDVLDLQIEFPQVVCAACGCPQSGIPTYRVLVAPDDVDAMIAVGWYAER